jgi:hypothetical protein
MAYQFKSYPDEMVIDEVEIHLPGKAGIRAGTVQNPGSSLCLLPPDNLKLLPCSLWQSISILTIAHDSYLFISGGRAVSMSVEHLLYK